MIAFLINWRAQNEMAGTNYTSWEETKQVTYMLVFRGSSEILWSNEVRARDDGTLGYSRYVQNTIQFSEIKHVNQL